LIPARLRALRRDAVRRSALGNPSKEIVRNLAVNPCAGDTCRGRAMETLGRHSLADVARSAMQSRMLG
jgi:FixJ family two-component response regulator